MVEERPLSPSLSSERDDRRRRRSADPLIALHYQLSSTRSKGELDAIVVADTSGVVVAGAGSWPVCEELAAYAPLLADGSWGSMTAQVSSHIDSLRKDAIIQRLSIAGQEVLLCARHKKKTEAFEAVAAAARDLDEAAQGVSRILSTAA